MEFTRRQASTMFAGLAVAVASNGFASSAAATAAPVRIPLSKFVTDQKMLDALRKGVTAMKKRKTSDPLSWNYQAAIHGITCNMVAKFAIDDAAVVDLNQDRYWNQCPHNGQNSANFLPWHRAYTHYFEKILRMHTEVDDFALPYWDYDTPGYLDFPKEFGIKHLDLDEQNDADANINPLYCEARDYYLCSYEPAARHLPLTQLGPRAVDASIALASPVFFGDSETTGLGGGIADANPSTRGLLEQSPHDQIHRSVGGIVTGTDENHLPVEAMGWMAVPATAGFDPIFSVHHSNMDRLWMKWSCMPGKQWGKLPSQDWFDEAPWFFFDTDGKVVNLPRKTYFDHRALGVRFSDEDLGVTPLALPVAITGTAHALMAMPSAQGSMNQLRSSLAITAAQGFVATVSGPTTIPLTPKAPPPQKKGLLSSMLSVDLSAEAITVTLHDVDIDKVRATGFDVYLVQDGALETGLTPKSPGYLGPVSLFNHASMHGMSSTFDQVFDLVPALKALNHASLSGVHIVIVPYALSTPRGGAEPLKLDSGSLKSNGISITQSWR